MKKLKFTAILLVVATLVTFFTSCSGAQKEPDGSYYVSTYRFDFDKGTKTVSKYIVFGEAEECKDTFSYTFAENKVTAGSDVYYYEDDVLINETSYNSVFDCNKAEKQGEYIRGTAYLGLDVAMAYIMNNADLKHIEFSADGSCSFVYPGKPENNYTTEYYIKDNSVFILLNGSGEYKCCAYIYNGIIILADTGSLIKKGERFEISLY